MRTRIYGKAATLFVILAILVSFSSVALAQYSGGGRVSSSLRSAINKLNKEDAVEELSVPVIGVAVSDITQNFGDPRDGGARTHEGLDIMAPKGAHVVSPTDAVVTRVGDGSDSGLYVRTANPGGETFVYMHLSAFAEDLEAGDVLEPGDLIGYVGNTGNASGGPAHLHFEIRDGRTALDPYQRLTKDASAVAGGGANAGAGLAALFTRDLEIGMEGEDVRLLQVFLNGIGYRVSESGVGSPGQESNYFGAKTQAALARYQQANGITPTAGYFGPKTRSVLALAR